MNLRNLVRLTATIAMAVTFSIGARAACGGVDVEFVGASAVEASRGCQALAWMTDHFRSIGVRGADRLRIIFEDVVRTPDGTKVIAYFESDLLEIRMTKFESLARGGADPIWNVDWDENLAASFLAHEIAHFVIVTHMGPDRRKLSRAWHEALAYHAQFLSMDEGFRAVVLARNSHLKPFAHLMSVNLFVYGAAPHDFAIRSYISIENWSAETSGFVKKLISGEVEGTGEEDIIMRGN